MKFMTEYLLVALGGAIGSVARHGAAAFSVNFFGKTFPWGTMIVNVTGSFIIGLIAGLVPPDDHGTHAHHLRTFFMVGLCGGYTTFSSFSLQTLSLMQDGHLMSAMLNVLGSVVLCLVAVWLGHTLAGATR